MGSKKSGVMEKIREGKEVGSEAIERGEQLESEGTEIRALLDSIEVVDEDDRRAVSEAQSNYDPAFKGAFSENVESLNRDMETMENDAIDESSDEMENVEVAEGLFKDMEGASEVGQSIAGRGADSMRDSAREYEEFINEANDVISETQAEVDSLRSAIDSIF